VADWLLFDSGVSTAGNPNSKHSENCRSSADSYFTVIVQPTMRRPRVGILNRVAVECIRFDGRPGEQTWSRCQTTIRRTRSSTWLGINTVTTIAPEAATAVTKVAPVVRRRPQTLVIFGAGGIDEASGGTGALSFGTSRQTSRRVCRYWS